MEQKKFKCAAIFKEDELQENLMACVLSCADKYDEVVILSEDEYSMLTPFAEIKNSYSGRELTVSPIHEDSKMIEMVFNISEIIRAELSASPEQCIDIVEAITRKYNISNK